MLGHIRRDFRRCGESLRERVREMLLNPGMWAVVGYRFLYMPLQNVRADFEEMKGSVKKLEPDILKTSAERNSLVFPAYQGHIHLAQQALESGDTE